MSKTAISSSKHPFSTHSSHQMPFPLRLQKSDRRNEKCLEEENNCKHSNKWSKNLGSSGAKCLQSRHFFEIHFSLYSIFFFSEVHFPYWHLFAPSGTCLRTAKWVFCEIKTFACARENVFQSHVLSIFFKWPNTTPDSLSRGLQETFHNWRPQHSLGYISP